MTLHHAGLFLLKSPEHSSDLCKPMQTPATVKAGRFCDTQCWLKPFTVVAVVLSPGVV